ncbi:MAG: hypothetical protein RBT76_02810 [candidate division Zixibacteria bacterium]|nr:hypothetical protein [candidate division Zixibacteria bacterium]
MTNDSTARSWTWSALSLSALFVIARFVGLDADPPAMFQRLGHALVTDPYYYTWFARNAVLFGDWDPLNYDRYAIFGHSIVSVVAYLVFSVAGVSRITAHVTSLILSLTGMALFAAAFWSSLTRGGRGLLVLLLSSNVFLFYYSRYPLMESGLLFYAGLLSLVFFRSGDRGWGQLLTGLVIALTALTGKLLGAMLLAPVIVAIITRGPGWSPAALARVVSGSAIGLVVYVIVFWGGSPAGLMDYLDEVRATVASDGSTSLAGLFTSLVSYWANPTIVRFQSALIAAAMLGGIATALSPLRRLKEDNGITAYNITWIIVATVILSLPEWRPARHMIFVLLPVCWLAATTLGRVIAGESPPIDRAARWRWLLVWIIGVSLIAVIVGQFSDVGSGRLLFGRFWLLIVAAASALSAVLWYVGKRPPVGHPSRFSRIVAALVAVVIVIQSACYVARGLGTLRYEMCDLSRDLAQLLPESAVLAGPNAPALTIDNRLRGILEFLGPRPPDRYVFQKNGVTHVAIAPSRWNWLREHTAVNDSGPNVFNKTVRGSAIQFRRLSPAGDSHTTLDSMIDAFYVGNSVSARALIDRLLARYPDNLLLQQFEVNVYYLSRNLPGTLSAIAQLSERYPDNYDVQYGCAMMAVRLYRVSSNVSLLQYAEQYLDRANRLDPPEPINLQRLQQIVSGG